MQRCKVLMALRATLTLGLLAPVAALAADLTPWLRLEGFGTLAAYAGDDEVAEVRADLRNPESSSRRRWRWDGDSQLSTQLTLNPRGPLRAALQLLAKDDVSDRFRPQVEWLYASYDARPELNLKAGRVVLPTFLHSDTRNVAYAQTAARPANTVYVLSSVTHVDGASLAYQDRWQGWEISTDLTAGQSRVGSPAGQVDLPRLWSAALQVGRSSWHLRGAHLNARVDMVLPGFALAMQGLTANSPANPCANCAEVFARRTAFTGVSVNIDALAATWEPAGWRLQAEWVRRRSTSTLLPGARAWYVQVARPLGEWTPYAVWGAIAYTDPPLGLAAKPGYPPAAAAAVAAFDRFLQSRFGRDIWQLGLRWDFADRWALKVQHESFRNTQETRVGQTGLLSYPAPPPVGSYAGPAWDGALKMTTVKLDFVF